MHHFTPILAAIALLSCLDSRADPQPAKIPESLRAYNQKLQAFRTGTGALSEVYSSGRKAAKDLLGSAGTSTVIESLSEPDFGLARKLMEGFSVNREEALFAQAQPDFFSALAQKKGTEADKAFFTLQKETLPDGVWPAYVEQQTDVSGCDRYDGTMTRLYGKWREFHRKFPKAYAQEAQDRVSDIESRFTTNGVCACESEDAVLKEFNAFIQAAPAKVADRARAKLKDLEGKSSSARYQCESG